MIGSSTWAMKIIKISIIKFCLIIALDFHTDTIFEVVNLMRGDWV
jgi:hypothetical protein